MLDKTSGKISGKPSKHGEFEVTLTASNEDAVSNDFTLTLSVSPKAAPIITSSRTVKGTTNGDFGYEILAKGATSFTAKGLPEGLMLDKTSGKISGKPSKYGEFKVTLSASNEDAVSSEDFTLTLSVSPEEVQDAIFTVEFRKFLLTECDVDKKEFWGTLELAMYTLTNALDSDMKKMPVFNHIKENWLKFPKQQEIRLGLGDFMVTVDKGISQDLTNEDVLKILQSIESDVVREFKDYQDPKNIISPGTNFFQVFTVPADYVEKRYISLTGKMNCEYCGGGIYEGLAQQYANGAHANSVYLRDVKVGNPVVKHVVMDYKDSGSTTAKFEVTATFVVTRYR